MPIVAVMIPGYGEVVGLLSIESDGRTAPPLEADRARRVRLRQGEPVPVLAEPVRAVLLRVPPDREDDVREREIDDGVAVPAVPDREPVEADVALEERQPREQQHLDQREVAGEERRQAARAEQEVVEAREPVVGDAVAVALARAARAARRALPITTAAISVERDRALPLEAAMCRRAIDRRPDGGRWQAHVGHVGTARRSGESGCDRESIKRAPE